MSVSPLHRPTPTPPRPLGPEGTKLWVRVWAMPAAWINPVLDLDHVTLMCELVDERSILRLKVLQDSDLWRERNGLRALDTAIVEMLGALGMNPTERLALAQPGGGDSAAATRLSQLRQRTRVKPTN